MMICQIIGMTLGLKVFQAELMNESADTAINTLIFLGTCLLNAGAIMYFIKHANLYGWRLAGVVFILGFGLMYFMSQIETLWFNESVQFPIDGLLGIVTGGAITFMIFSPLAVLLMGKFRRREFSKVDFSQIDKKELLLRISIISIIVWPILYFLAGYYIAWQFEDIRIYYTGSPEKEAFFPIMAENLKSNLYYFQIIRGFLWVFFSMFVLKFFEGSTFQKGMSLISFLVLLCCIQLLLENPFMPESVRMAHLIETSIENAILGLIITWLIETVPDTKTGSVQVASR